ncbi:hypothetical protein, partial [Metallibacterium scheffleri]|uniref:hypothetical protein n=1 Tax=Metallibacterium scheffleri TaxID=993689 RepID=UPI0023F1F229
DGAGFDAAVAAGGLAEVGTPRALGEVALEVAQQRRMIAFDGEVVMRETAAYELRDGALGEQCVGGDVLVRKVQRLEQRDGGFDLVGLLEGVRITRYGQETDFFWE